MDNSMLLVTLFCYVSEKLKTDITKHVDRLSNNSQPAFTDEEVITVYMFGIIKYRTKTKCIYNYVKNHYADWFPELPSYTAFINRINRICNIFAPLCEAMLVDFQDDKIIKNIMLIDAMPIVMANAKRSSQAKVASEWANKGYCSSKKMYYYGAKIHVLGFKRQGTIPKPDFLLATPASEHDLTILKDIFSQLGDIDIYADKAYSDEILEQVLKDIHHVNLYTPVKKKKNQKYLEFDDQLFSTEVSRVRQPIESFFNWLDEHTGIQKASKVRSLKGLITHIFGRLASAIFLLAFNP